MLAYIAAISVINLVLGMLLARMLSSPKPVATSAKLDHDPLTTASIVETLQGTGERTAEEPEHNATTGPAPYPDSEQPAADIANDYVTGPPDPWAEIAAQLHELAQEVQACRTASDPQAVLAAAARLRTQSVAWQQQCEDALQPAQTGKLSTTIATAESSTAIEALASQIETTLFRIDALDFDSLPAALLDSLQGEIELLESLHKSVTETLHQTAIANN